MTELNRPIDERGENKYLNKWVFPRGMKREGATATTAVVEAQQPGRLTEARPCRPRAQSPVNRRAGLSHSARKIEDAGGSGAFAGKVQANFRGRPQGNSIHAASARRSESRRVFALPILRPSPSTRSSLNIRQQQVGSNKQECRTPNSIRPS